MVIYCLKYGIVKVEEFFLHSFVLFMCTKYDEVRDSNLESFEEHRSRNH
jgi:hypothetical protein